MLSRGKVWGFLYVNGRQTEQTTKAMGGAPPGAGGAGGGSSPLSAEILDGKQLNDWTGTMFYYNNSEQKWPFDQSLCYRL